MKLLTSIAALALMAGMTSPALADHRVAAFASAPINAKVDSNSIGFGASYGFAKLGALNVNLVGNLANVRNAETKNGQGLELQPGVGLGLDLGKNFQLGAAEVLAGHNSGFAFGSRQAQTLVTFGIRL